MDKERREKLERKLQSGNSVPVKDVRLDADELRAFLDLADERDRYRALLRECLDGKSIQGRTNTFARIGMPPLVTTAEGVVVDDLRNRIDAALEGKTNE